MKTRPIIAALLAGLLFAPFVIAEETGDEAEDQNMMQGCFPMQPICIIPCWPTHTYETGDLIPPVWFQIRHECLPV